MKKEAFNLTSGPTWVYGSVWTNIRERGNDVNIL